MCVCVCVGGGGGGGGGMNSKHGGSNIAIVKSKVMTKGV